MTKTIGILGGMGPYASFEFYKRVLALTPATTDRDHLRIILDVNPHIPSRTRHILYGEASPVPGMVDSLKRLQSYPVDEVYIPCNSACFFIDDIRRQVAVPVINIIERTCTALKQFRDHSRSVMVLGAPITYKKQTYKPFINALGMEYLNHDEDIQLLVEKIIYSIKDFPSTAQTEQLAAVMGLVYDKYRPDIIILGCTELSVKFDPRTHNLPTILVDSCTELARYLVRSASGSCNGE